VRLGERPRTVAFGDNDTFNVLNVKAILDIERYGRVNVDAAGAEFLYADRRLLEPAHNTGFLRRCVEGFRKVNFADQASGRIYLRIESGAPESMDKDALESAISDADTWTGVDAVAPSALHICAARTADGLQLWVSGGPIAPSPAFPANRGSRSSDRREPRDPACAAAPAVRPTRCRDAPALR